MSHAPLSPAALEARRQNARQSTGPRTEAGKNRSRWNALQHGGFATGLAWSDAALRALGEDPEEFRQLVEGLKTAEGPAADPLWELQLEDLARLYWRRRRLERAWEEWARRQGRDDAVLTPLDSQGALLLKQLDSVDRAIDRKTRLLLRMRESVERARQYVERRKERERRERERPARENPGVLDRLRSGKSLTWAQVAKAEVELEDMNAETARLEADTQRMQAELAAMQKASELEERSEEVIENKGPDGKDSDK